MRGTQNQERIINKMLTEIINGQRKFKSNLDLNFNDTLFQTLKELGFYQLGDYRDGVIDGIVFTKDKMLIHIQKVVNEIFFLEKEGTYLLGIKPSNVKNYYKVILYEQKGNIRVPRDIAHKITLQETYDNLFDFLRASFLDTKFSLIKGE